MEYLLIVSQGTGPADDLHQLVCSVHSEIALYSISLSAVYTQDRLLYSISLSAVYTQHCPLYSITDLYVHVCCML